MDINIFIQMDTNLTFFLNQLTGHLKQNGITYFGDEINDNESGDSIGVAYSSRIYIYQYSAMRWDIVI